MGNDMPVDIEGRILRMIEMQKSVSIQLYKYCLLAGFDPETFNYKDYSEKNLIGIQLNENTFFLKGYSEKMVKIEKILEELNNKEL
jgi:hypothetical protein